MRTNKWFQIGIIGFFIAFSASLLTGCNKKEDVIILSGSVEATQYEVISEVAGKIIAVEQEEGTKILKGDVLAKIDSSLQELAIKQQEAIVQFKKAKLEELKAGTRAEEIEQAEAGVDAAKSAVNAAKTSVESAQINYNYWVNKYNQINSLHTSDAVSDDDLNDAKFKTDTAKQQLEAAQKELSASQARLKSAQSKLDLLKSGATAQTIKASEADLQQAEAALEQAKLVLSKYQVKSPVNGTLVSKNISLGDMVNAGTSLGTVSDLTDLWVRVYIPQRHISAVSLNQEINLTTVSLPDQYIKGKIIFIASEAEFTPKNTETTEAKENTVFKLKIKILDHIENLKPGMTVDAIIPLAGGE